jgi:methyl-accepting chemotaxis protein
LVDKAGVTMTEVVSSIRRVTDIVGEISAASSEQSAGVAQVGEAVSQMDQATQQNAALVEQMAAAASSLKSQAHDLVQVVSTFKLNASDQASASGPRLALNTSANFQSRPASNLPKLAQRPQAAPHKAALAKPAPAKAVAPSPKTKTPAIAAPKPLAKPAAPAKAAVADDEWETF